MFVIFAIVAIAIWLIGATIFYSDWKTRLQVLKKTGVFATVGIAAFAVLAAVVHLF
jgi:hypothetical protein